MALRMKTRFRGKGPKTIADRANVIAFNIWRVAQETCKRMEKEGFKFASDTQLTEVITEVIAFLVQIADRIVYGQLSDADRHTFINALGQDLAGHMARNLEEIAGPGESAVASSLVRGPRLGPIGDHAAGFIATLNARFADYAECEYTLSQGPGYSFLRFLGEKVAAVMAATDNKWVVEQVMDIEAPEAVKAIKKLVHEVMGVKVS
jgi:hypothetical protein